VPEQHTDFIFTAVGEELGFVGSVTVLGLMALICVRIWRTAQIAHDRLGMLICIGVLSMLVFQIFQNVGMTMGIMPITGITLPFMSYGGPPSPGRPSRPGRRDRSRAPSPPAAPSAVGVRGLPRCPATLAMNVIRLDAARTAPRGR
jgi:hypothetical protein